MEGHQITFSPSHKILFPTVIAEYLGENFASDALITKQSIIPIDFVKKSASNDLQPFPYIVQTHLMDVWKTYYYHKS